MPSDPVLRDGVWWVYQDDGSWLHWDEASQQWLKYEQPAPAAPQPAPVAPQPVASPSYSTGASTPQPSSSTSGQSKTAGKLPLPAIIGVVAIAAIAIAGYFLFLKDDSNNDAFSAARANGGNGSAPAGTTSNDGSTSSSSSSSSNLTGDAKDIDAVVRGYFEAMLKQDANKAYTYLDSGSKAKCDQAKFANNVDGLNALFQMFGQQVKYSKAVNISVSGNTATAGAEIIIDGKPLSSGPIETDLNKEGGKWLVQDVCQ